MMEAELTPYHYPGFNPFVAEAAKGFPDADPRLVAGAGDTLALLRLSKTISQAGQHPAPIRAEMLAAARRFRDALAVYVAAADLILAHAEEGLGLAVPEHPTPPVVAAPTAPPAEPRRRPR
jgi:hypothetical protein